MESKRFIFSSGSYKKIRGRIEYDFHIVTYHSVSLRMELNIWQLQELFSKKAFSFFSKRLNSYVIAYNDVLPLEQALIPAKPARTGLPMIYFLLLGEKSKSNAPHISRVGMLIVFQKYSSASARLDHGIPKMTLAMMPKDGPTFMCSAYTQAKTGAKHRFSLNNGNFIFCLHRFLTSDARTRKAFPSALFCLFLLQKLHTRN